MIESRFRRHFESFSDNESWEEYSERLNISNNDAQGYFYQHVIFEHYDDFCRRFPWFNLELFTFTFENWQGITIHELIKYDYRKEIDWWYSHVEQNRPFRLLEFMTENLTWPKPIVIFDFLGKEPNYEILSPVHLIEGTHRVSYLKKLMLLDKIDFKSLHSVLVLRLKI